MKIKFFSTEIYISFLFAAVIAFLLLTDRTGLIVPTLFAVMIHETGHLFAMWVMDCSPKSIRLIPASVQIVRSFSPRPHGESAIALCGPLSNIVIFLTLWFNYLVFKNETVLEFAILNLVLGTFNLLPVKGLDGGTLLNNFLCKYTDDYHADRTIRVLTLIIAACALSAGIYLAFKGKLNISAFIVALYLAVTALIKK